MTDDQKAPVQPASVVGLIGCHRSHPHENMSPECEAKTIKARLDSVYRRFCAAPEYTQGVCADGAAILEDGRMLTIEEILDRLQARAEIEGKLKVMSRQVEVASEALLHPATLEETTPDEGMQGLAFKIADESAVSLLESSLLHLGDSWLDTATAEPADDPAILEAIEYLELRGMLERNPTSDHLVRIIEQEAPMTDDQIAPGAAGEQQAWRDLLPGERIKPGDRFLDAGSEWVEVSPAHLELSGVVGPATRLHQRKVPWPTSAVPEGWKLVPVDPTPEMIAALGFGDDVDAAIGHAYIYNETVDLYHAMLAAAPQATLWWITDEWGVKLLRDGSYSVVFGDSEKYALTPQEIADRLAAAEDDAERRTLIKVAEMCQGVSGNEIRLALGGWIDKARGAGDE